MMLTVTPQVSGDIPSLNGRVWKEGFTMYNLVKKQHF